MPLLSAAPRHLCKPDRIHCGERGGAEVFFIKNVFLRGLRDLCGEYLYLNTVTPLHQEIDAAAEEIVQRLLFDNLIREPVVIL